MLSINFYCNCVNQMQLDLKNQVSEIGTQIKPANIEDSHLCVSHTASSSECTNAGTFGSILAAQ